MIDPTATEPLKVRCVCPPLADGTPRHDEDTIDVRSQYGYGDSLNLSRKGVQYKIGVNPETKDPVVLPFTDAFAEHEALLEMAVTGWTLTDGKGDPLPVALSTILLLPEDVGNAVANAANAHYEASKAPVPNASGGPSPAGSPETPPARPNRATRRSKKPSTPSSN